MNHLKKKGTDQMYKRTDDTQTVVWLFRVEQRRSALREGLAAVNRPVGVECLLVVQRPRRID